MAHSPVEEVRVLFFNAKNMLIAIEAMWRGSVDEASMHVREVMKRAMPHGATAISSSTITQAATRRRVRRT